MAALTIVKAFAPHIVHYIPWMEVKMSSQVFYLFCKDKSVKQSLLFHCAMSYHTRAAQRTRNPFPASLTYIIDSMVLFFSLGNMCFPGSERKGLIFCLSWSGLLLWVGERRKAADAFHPYLCGHWYSVLDPRPCSPHPWRIEWQCVKAGRALIEICIQFGGSAEDETRVQIGKKFPS